MRPVLQLALDVDSVDEALRLAELAAPWVDWLEVGTSLIVAEGVRVVETLRERYPSHLLVADIKIIDGAQGLASLVLKAGADMVTVVHSAYDDTVAAAVKVAHALDRRVVGEYYSLDFGATAPFERLVRLGIDYVGLHLPYAPGSLRSDAIEAIRETLPAISLPVIVAGGIDVAVLRRLRGVSLAGVIIGGAILNASHPGDAAREIHELLSCWSTDDLTGDQRLDG